MDRKIDDEKSIQIELIRNQPADHVMISSECFLSSQPSSSMSLNNCDLDSDSSSEQTMNQNDEKSKSSEIKVDCDCNDVSNQTDIKERNSMINSDSQDRCDKIRQCWVCLATDDEDFDTVDGNDVNQLPDEWIHPCRCSGTAKWVHQNCLQKWIDEKQKYNSSLNVSCTQCNTEYFIVFPRHGKFFYVIELCDRLLYSVAPLATITCIVGSIYWSAVCYGAFTLMQILGKENGKNVIEQSDPLVLLVGLPSIPVALVLSKLIRWEDQILKLWLKNNFRLPLFGYILGKPAEKSREFAGRTIFPRDSMSDPISICRNFCGALILPTAATIFGSLFFDNIKSNFSRALLGGLTFVLSKGFIKILLRQNQYIRQTHRKILNFDNKVINDN
ncbi:E3 ubiquitin-protein ligase MARCH5 [Sarcoptes scabiei]|uniref:E3 ubiquitin-protein ligase MARCHF5 n=1 Tax=Sarcoptes scabiei TaxID=52283 RepID=A0A834VBG2_SARSC|nr:E3 ubiquitin-protein ligase MARCH5 [Sarcoptes scabiei]